MAKNTGKTECLNYIIKRLHEHNKTAAVTSIGIDGENIDQVTNSHKPEIKILENMIFVTTENFFKQKHIISEILDVSEEQTQLGRFVTAKAKNSGNIILAGPSSTQELKLFIGKLSNYEPDIILIDGALSRSSFGAPSITESMILTTGAALSANVATLVKKTKFLYSLINLPQYSSPIDYKLNEINGGVWAIDKNLQLYNLDIKSTLLLEKSKDKLTEFGNTIYVSGIVTDKILNNMRIQKNVSDVTIIAKDFTKIFVTPEAYNAYMQKGGKINVLLKTKLIAICVNPTSPEGYTLESNILISELEKAMNIPVYNIKSNRN
jgi:hypothetical protein